MFLDVEMPKKSGIELLAEVEHKPYIIFTTAYNHFAVKAFEEGAIDYLLKPYSDQRFFQALDRARSRMQETNAYGKLEQVLGLLQEGDAGSDRFIKNFSVSIADKIMIVPVEDVVWISAAGNYVELNLADRKYLYYSSLSDLELRLDPNQLIRINRSYMVRKSAVRSLRRVKNGEYFVILSTGDEVKLSRSYRDKVRHFLKED